MTSCLYVDSLVTMGLTVLPTSEQVPWPAWHKQYGLTFTFYLDNIPTLQQWWHFV